MRIIAGQAGGRRLLAPSGLDTRPTSDKIRAAIRAGNYAVYKKRMLDGLREERA